MFVVYTDDYCKVTPDVETYAGKTSVSVNGIPCGRWDSSYYYNNDSYFIDGSASAAENYCRKPSDEDFDEVWCYTWGDTRWETCDVIYCNDSMYCQCSTVHIII